MLEDVSAPWWAKKKKSDILSAVQGDYSTLQSQGTHRDAYTTYERIYRGEALNRSVTLEAELAALGQAITSYQRPTYNLLATVTDNITSRIVRNKPRAVYQVDGANWSLRRMAKAQQKWVDYVSHSGDFSKISREVVRDGVLLGVGVCKVYRKPYVDEIGVCKVHPADVFVDPIEATYGEPTRLFERRFVTKESAKVMFPKHAKAIDEAGIISSQDFSNRQEFSHTASMEMVEIVEAWKLPTWVRRGETSGDGKHVIFIDGELLFEEEWKRPDFPILTYRWQSRPSDFWHGIAVPEQILSIHLDLNFSLQMIHEAAELTPSPIILSPANAKVSRDEMSNLPAQIWEYQGSQPPVVVQNPKIQSDLLQYMQEQEARAYRRLGLDSSTPNAPSPGLETGRAVRMDFDVRSMAFTSALQNFEALYAEFARKAVAAGREIWESNKDFSVVVPKDKWTVQDIPWKDIDLDQRDASYIVKVSVGSQLSQHPAGRIDDVANLVNMGAVSEASEMRALLDLPDLEHSNDLATAAREAIESMCEDMLDEGIPHMPEPYDDLELCLSVVNAHYLRARTMKAPEDRLDLLRKFLDRTTALINQRQQAQLAAQQVPGMVPGSATPPLPNQQGALPTAI